MASMEERQGRVLLLRLRVQDRLRSRAKEQGFSLVELLVVIGIIGILAAIAIPQFAAYRKKGYDSEMVSELRNAVTAQEAYYTKTLQYTDSMVDLNTEGFTSNPKITLTITAATGPPPNYTMTATHSDCTAGSSRTFNGVNYSFGGTGCQ